jgi:hypothetical protein
MGSVESFFFKWLCDYAQKLSAVSSLRFWRANPLFARGSWMNSSPRELLLFFLPFFDLGGAEVDERRGCYDCVDGGVDESGCYFCREVWARDVAKS